MSISPTNMFLETGPIVSAEIHLDENSFLLNKNMQGFAPFAKVKLLVDTGSNISGIDRRIIHGLKLSQYQDNSEVNGVGGTHSLSRFRCILFLKIFGMKGLPLDVLEGDYSNSPYDGIIGRDVLQFCSFEYHGPSNSFELQAINF
ncbi:MAG: retropepsin-like domain-containing protein [Chitinophagaceae bacterium]|nr:retropepsin-like domain-containing protein [Chitinophagaceae bacterium]